MSLPYNFDTSTRSYQVWNNDGKEFLINQYIPLAPYALPGFDLSGVALYKEWDGTFYLWGFSFYSGPPIVTPDFIEIADLTPLKELIDKNSNTFNSGSASVSVAGLLNGALWASLIQTAPDYKLIIINTYINNVNLYTLDQNSSLDFKLRYMPEEATLFNFSSPSPFNKNNLKNRIYKKNRKEK